MMISVLVVFLASIMSCDVIDGAYLENNQNTNPGVPADDSGTISTYRKVFVEDFTGHTCGNCPDAARLIEQLKMIYGDTLISMGTHLGFFAKLKSPSGQYSMDFNTEIGKALDQQFSIDAAGVPRGFISRTENGGTRLLSPAAWASTISQLVNTEPVAGMKITNSYNAATRELNTTVTIQYYKEGNLNHKLAVYLTEDSIISWQKDYKASPEDVSNYVHRHVLRGAVNSTWGDQLSTEIIPAGTILTKSYTFPVKAAWNEKHCAVVALLHDQTTYEVIQVEERKIK